ncbi:MAG: hypothetical protein ACREMD_04645, partial [Gemmatimonadota bacterium]
MRLRNRILFTYLAFGLVLTLIAGVLLYRATTAAARSGIEDRVATGVRLAAATLERGAAPSDGTGLDLYVDQLARAADARITLVAPDGRVIADSEFDGAALAALDDHDNRAEIVEARAGGEGHSVRYSRSVGTQMLYRARLVDEGPWSDAVVR